MIRWTWVLVALWGLGCAPLRIRTPGLSEPPQCVTPIARPAEGQLDSPGLAAEAAVTLSRWLGARSARCEAGAARVEVWARTRPGGSSTRLVLGARALSAEGPLWEREFEASSTDEGDALQQTLEELRRFASLDPSAGRVFLFPLEVLRVKVRSWFGAMGVELEDEGPAALSGGEVRVVLVPVDAHRTLLELFGPGGRDHATEAKLAEQFDLEVSGGLSEVDVEPLPAFAPLTVPAKPAAPATRLEEACEVRLADESDLAPGHVMLLPDLEGSRETPQVVERVVCAALHLGREVTVALDIDSSEQARLNTFLSSKGTAADRAELTRGRFWQRIWQDGRSSLAMTELLERLRSWRQGGRPVTVLAMDLPVPGNPRAARMLTRLVSHHASAPRSVVIAYTSNTLGRLVLSDDLPAFQPLGYRLRAAGLQVSAWDLSFNSGARWACRSEGRDLLRCGTWPVSPGDASDNDVRHSTTRFSPHPGVHSGSVCVGVISPSPPATGDQPDEGLGYMRRRR